MPPHTSVRRGHRVPPRTRHGARGFHAPGSLLLLVALASCGESREGKGDSARTAGAAVAAAPAIPSLPECPNKSGRWDECNVRQRLERAGLAPQPLPDTIRHPFLRVPGIAYRVGHAELEVFLYDSAGALRRDLAALDTVRVQPTGDSAVAVAWSATPTLITSNNLAAILLSDQGTQIERVRLALTAGLPAPDTHK